MAVDPASLAKLVHILAVVARFADLIGRWLALVRRRAVLI